MRCNRHIRNLLGRTLICTISILLISTGFSFGDATAENCRGGAECLVCAQQPHAHIPGAEADMVNPDCPPGGKNSSCGFESGQDPAEFHGLVSSVRSYQAPYAGIFTTGLNQYGQIHLNGEWIPPLFLTGSGVTAPIYLLNQSQLC